MNTIKKACALLLCAMLLSCFGCTAPGASLEAGNLAKYCQDNEILSYKPIDTAKLIICIGNNMNANTEPLEAALSARFEGVEFVTTIGSGYGFIEQQARFGEMPDIFFYMNVPELAEHFYDLSACDFTNRYNLTSLNALSVDDKIYQLPIASSAMGIFYNKTLFDEKGWSVPNTIDEFYALCEVIADEGIRPFAPCFKYMATVADVGIGLSNRALFSEMESAAHFYAFANGERSSEGVMEPFLLALRELYDRGLITESDFSSSATQNRQAMYAGEVAMVPYGLNLVSFYDVEQPDCELGLMGFPTDVPGEHCMPFSHDGTCMSLSRQSMEDPDKKELLLEIFDFLSTDEGQDVLFECFPGISSVKTYQSNIATRFAEVTECMDQGRMYFPEQFWSNDDAAVVEAWVTGKMTLEEMLAAMDQIVQDDMQPAAEAESIGVATERFTILETSALMADAFRETTGADVALMLCNATFKGTLMKLYEGEITFPGVFYIRGLSGENCLTVYEIMGAALKELMEHPFVNGEEINAAYIPSGLKMTYAPWRAMDGNVLNLTLADGTPIDDETAYRVAAWDTTIDERYITATLTRYEQYNNTTDYMTEFIKAKGTVSPPRDGRVTLDWSQE